MLNRTAILSLAVAGLFWTVPAGRCLAQSPATSASVQLISFEDKHDAESKDKDHDEHDKKDADDEKDDDHHEGAASKKDKEIEQDVPMNMVPQGVLDAVKKEVPGGTITEAELVAKKGKIMYSFDVKAGDMAYDVKITVDGKFFEKKVDDDQDEKDEKPKKPGTGDKM